MDSIVHVLMAAYLMVTPLVSYKLGQESYRLSCSSGPGGHSNGEHQASKLLAQNSTAAEITQHKYSHLMAAGYLMVTPLVSYKLGQESYRLSSSSGPSGPSNGEHQTGKLLAQNPTAAEITQHKYSGLMATIYAIANLPINDAELANIAYQPNRTDCCGPVDCVVAVERMSD